jgi:sugar (pentulose or hexulose) kinase
MTAPERAEVLRSVLEGIAFALRANLEQIEAIAGLAIPSVALGGGMTRGALFPGILADVLGRAVHVARTPETSALGAAAVASPALGLHATLEAAIDAMTPGGSVVEPQMRTSAVYDDVYARWCALADTLVSEGT